MGLDNIASEDDIVAQIETIPGIDVIQGEYADDSFIPTVDANKLFKPYVLVKFNGGFPAYDNGIVGYDKDTQRATFSVYVVSPGDRATRVIRNQVRTKLINFTPTDSSAIGPAGSYSFVDSDLGYNRYVHNIGFWYNYNLNYEI